MNKQNFNLIALSILLLIGATELIVAQPYVVKTGIVQHIIADSPLQKDKETGKLVFPENGKADNKFYLLTPAREWIKLDDGQATQWMVLAHSRRDVEISGTMRNGALSASDTKFVDANFVEPDLPSRTAGDLRVHIVPVQITFVPAGTELRSPSAVINGPSFITIEQAKWNIFHAPNSSKAFFLNNSDPFNDPTIPELLLIGKDGTDGDFTAVTIDARAPTPAGCDNALLQTIAPTVDRALAEIGRDADVYHSTIYVFDDILYSQMGCTFGGIGSVSPPRVLNSGGRIWMPKFLLLNSVHTITHELGHNLSLGHSHSVRDGVILEYGDQTCVQGGRYYRFNNYQLHRLGWGEFKQIPNQSSGVYDVFASVLYKPRLRQSQLQFSYASLSETENIYPEARVHRVPFEDFSFPSILSYAQGITLRTGPKGVLTVGATSTLIDARPDTQTSNDSGLVNASISVNGRLFTHQRNGSIALGTRVYIQIP